jgi:hypothetical protein
MTQAVRCQFSLHYFRVWIRVFQVGFVFVVDKVALGQRYVWIPCIHQSVLFHQSFFTSYQHQSSVMNKIFKRILRLVNCWVLIYRLHIWSFMYKEHKICATLISCLSKRSCRVLVEYFVVCVGNMFNICFVFLNQYLRKCHKTVFAEWFLISYVLGNAKFFQLYFRFHNTIALHMSAFSTSNIAYMPVCISRATVPIEPSFATYILYLLFIGCTSKNFYPVTTFLLKSTISIYCIKKFLLLHCNDKHFLWFLCIHILTVY